MHAPPNSPAAPPPIDPPLLLLAYRIWIHFIGPSTIGGALSIISTTALFADGIRVSINAMRSGQPNARFMLNSIIIMVLILLGGSVVGWFLSTRYPEYSSYAFAATNVLFFLTLPISFAIILAREYAQTSRSLGRPTGSSIRRSLPSNSYPST